jgi:hypothetical protein
MTVMVGENDDDPNDPDLRHTTGADAQGLHREARALYFYNKGQAAATSLSTPFNWSHQLVDDCAHSNACVAPTAAEVLFG